MYKRYYVLFLVFVLVILLIIFSELSAILAGVAILLIGMSNLSSGFKIFSGGLLETILKKSTDTRLKSIAFGTITTILMQSSTLVSIISISFLSAGLITLAQGIGIVFGANLGNSAGSWLIVGLTNINISALAIPLIVSGVLLGFQRDTILKGLGSVFMGIGFFFLGVDYIKGGFESYRNIVDLSAFDFYGIKGVLVFVLLGAAITSIVQSSHATIAIIISALISGQITYENALAATLGTSVGGVVTAIVASFSTSVDGKRLAIANCIFNFTIASIVIVLFPFFVSLVDFIANMIGISNVALKTALFHTLFNLVAVLFISLFIQGIVLFLNRFIKESKNKELDKPLYLNDSILEYPNTAIEALQKESEHLYNNAYAMIAHTIGFNRSDIKGKDSFESIIQNKKWFSGNVDLDLLYRQKIKVLFDSIMEFSTKAQVHVDDTVKLHRIFSFKIASRSITEATKNLKIVQANMKSYSNSENKYLADEYNSMRKDMGELLRSIENLKIMEEENVLLILKNLENAKKLLREKDYKALSRVEKLISDNKVSVTNGTSILNDSAFMAQIAICLIDAVVIIFSKEHYELMQDKSDN